MLTPTTELSVVNTMLSAIGESPVNTLEGSGVVDVVMARQVLHNVIREVQSVGWHFNTEINYPLQPTFDSGEIRVPETLIKLDSVSSSSGTDVVVRGTRLYDRSKRTYKFTEPLLVEMVILLPFNELPEPARQYIAVRAVRVFQQTIVGSGELAGFTAQDEMVAKVILTQMETDNADYNMLTDSYSVARVLER